MWTGNVGGKELNFFFRHINTGPAYLNLSHPYAAEAKISDKLVIQGETSMSC